MSRSLIIESELEIIHKSKTGIILKIVIVVLTFIILVLLHLPFHMSSFKAPLGVWGF